MTPKPFVSRAYSYNINVMDGLKLAAGPALLTLPDGGHEPAVVFRYDRRTKFVIPAAAAIRIANEIADAVEAVERRAS